MGARVSDELTMVLQYGMSLSGVGPTDPLTFGLVVAILAGVATLASYIPARRASRVDPIVSLHHE